MAMAEEENTKLIATWRSKISPKEAKNAMAVLPVYTMLAFDCTSCYCPSLKIIQGLMR